MIGKKIGKLTVVAFDSLRLRPGAGGKRAKYWKCVCECGNIHIGHTNGLNSGRVNSCGCKRKKIKLYQIKIKKKRQPHNFRGFELLSGDYVSSIKRHARDRDIYYDENIITAENLWNLLVSQSFICAISGKNIAVTRTGKDFTASLDRINSELGYTKDNIQWVHKDINWLKNRFQQDKFIELCHSVSKNNIDVGCYT